ncbi:MAG: nucleoside monophosphate kinase [Patescibacteria group bacterium]|nr:nucleoside monophosphate kinase [Patescibacteria group bacterium]
MNNEKTAANNPAPYWATKVPGVDRQFDLTKREEEMAYYEAKAGKEIRELKKYFLENKATVYLIGPKNSGKGTYTKKFQEIFGAGFIDHISIGDLVRDRDEVVQNPEKLEAFKQELRLGGVAQSEDDIEEMVTALKSRDVKTLLPTKCVLALTELAISGTDRADKTLFIDGFPRDTGQLSNIQELRALINRRDDDDVLVIIDIPENVIDARIRDRRICPQCHESRNVRLLPTTKVGFDKATNEFFLICDNPNCSGPKMAAKEGDENGLGAQRERYEGDMALIASAMELDGVNRIVLQNSIPIGQAGKYADDYEITPGFYYELGENNEVVMTKKPWQFKNNQGFDVYSFMPAPVVLTLIRELYKIFKPKIDNLD